ncbi:hypothetical protein Cgig2_004398 [Carnegiea gigantea]|uniref:Large ribosomal subunit protein bL31c n=1 Tax=Carnegiea gigantea TaxID=171969 RepID=A0A9Q1JRQ4_9CARY|nr:hypothetical protein Cgig2_004398 [Carnegiea gigantea]
MALALSNQFLGKHPLTPASITLRKPRKPSSLRPQISCRKKDIHPKFYDDAKVYCNGELVMTAGGTQKEYSVDVWSGNHPYYLGTRSSAFAIDDQLEKFRKRYGELTEFMQIPVLEVNGMKWVFSAWNLIGVFADIDIKTAFGWADEGNGKNFVGENHRWGPVRDSILTGDEEIFFPSNGNGEGMGPGS